MPRPAFAAAVCKEDLVVVKSEQHGKSEQRTAQHYPTEGEPEGPRTPTRKRKLASQPTEFDTDAADFDVGTDLTLDEEYEDVNVAAQNKPAPRKAKPASQYVKASKHYNVEIKHLKHPHGLAPDALAALYQRSMALVAFLKAELDYEHQRAAGIWASRAKTNVRLRHSTASMKDAKEKAKAAETKLEVYKTQNKDLSYQLTLKMADPIARTKIKYENAQSDSANKLTELQAKYQEEIEARKAAEAARDLESDEKEKLRSQIAEDAQAKDCDQQTLDSTLVQIQTLEAQKEEAERKAGAAVKAKDEAEAKFVELRKGTTVNPVAAPLTGTRVSEMEAEIEGLRSETDRLREDVAREKQLVNMLLGRSGSSGGTPGT